jgi:hypothetical protein
LLVAVAASADTARSSNLMHPYSARRSRTGAQALAVAGLSDILMCPHVITCHSAGAPPEGVILLSQPHLCHDCLPSKVTLEQVVSAPHDGGQCVFQLPRLLIALHYDEDTTVLVTAKHCECGGRVLS